MNQPLEEIWICNFSVTDWTSAEKWTDFFRRAEELLGARMTHLDDKDPIRRKVVSLEDAGQFITTFNPREGDRWLIGKFRDLGISFQISANRMIGNIPNKFYWYLPLKYCLAPGRWEIVRNLFLFSIDSLGPFYSYSDSVSVIRTKIRETGAIDIREELIGVMWLTWFNSAYYEYFGKDRFNGLPGTVDRHGSGVCVQLAPSPDQSTSEARILAERQLGRLSFVDPADYTVKTPGRYALTLEQLIAFNKR